MICVSYNYNVSVGFLTFIINYLFSTYPPSMIFLLLILFHIYSMWSKPQACYLTLSSNISINILFSLTNYIFKLYFCTTGNATVLYSWKKRIIFLITGLSLWSLIFYFNLTCNFWHQAVLQRKHSYSLQQIWNRHLPRKLWGKDLVFWWNPNWLFHKFQIQNYIFCSKLKAILHTMDSLYSYSKITSKGPTPTRPGGPKQKSRSKMQQAQTLQTSYESHIDKFQGSTPLENLLSLALRAEGNFTSTCIVLSGLSTNNMEWSEQRFNQWVISAAHYLHNTLGVTIDDDMLHEYLHTFSNSPWIFTDGGSRAFPIPILRQSFHMGGGQQHSSDMPSAFGINPGNSNEPFYTYQAIPSQTRRALFDLRNSVELCTFRGLPDSGEEIKAVLSLLQHRVTNHIARICQLPPTSFYVVLHRRTNTRAHYPGNAPSHEFVATVYCCPEEHSIISLRDKLSLANAPSESNLDWTGEVWGSYYSIQTSPPSMVLLHRTPRFCIRGFHPTATTSDIIRALWLDNPLLPVTLLVYIWLGLLDPITGTKILVLIFRGEIPPIVVGVHLVALGASCADGDPLDSPTMSKAREIIAGIILHHQFMANMRNRQGWTKGAQEAWSKQIDGILLRMPTLHNGHAVGITHAASTAWVEQPSFFPPDNNIRVARNSRLSSTSPEGSSLLQSQLANNMPLSTSTAYSSPSPNSGIHGGPPPEHYQEYFRQLLEAQSERLISLLNAQASNKRPASRISDSAVSSTEELPMDINHDQDT